MTVLTVLMTELIELEISEFENKKKLGAGLIPRHVRVPHEDTIKITF